MILVKCKLWFPNWCPWSCEGSKRYQNYFREPNGECTFNLRQCIVCRYKYWRGDLLQELALMFMEAKSRYLLPIDLSARKTKGITQCLNAWELGSQWCVCLSLSPKAWEQGAIMSESKRKWMSQIRKRKTEDSLSLSLFVLSRNDMC